MKSYFCLKEEKILARDKKGDRHFVFPLGAGTRDQKSGILSRGYRIYNTWNEVK